jgi:hypothetical protein
MSAIYISVKICVQATVRGGVVTIQDCKGRKGKPGNKKKQLDSQFDAVCKHNNYFYHKYRRIIMRKKFPNKMSKILLRINTFVGAYDKPITFRKNFFLIFKKGA